MLIYINYMLILITNLIIIHFIFLFSYRPTVVETDKDQRGEKTTVTSSIEDHDTDVTLPINVTFRYTTETVQNETFDLGTTVTDTKTVPPLTSTLLSVLSSTMKFDSTISTVSSLLTSSGISLSQSTGIEVNSSTTTLAPRNVTEVSNLHYRKKKRKRKQ